jgi:hypothetical protein
LFIVYRQVISCRFISCKSAYHIEATPFALPEQLTLKT